MSNKCLNSIDKLIIDIYKKDIDEIKDNIYFIFHSCLTVREEYVVEQRYMSNKTLEEIGNELKLTRERIRQIQNKALKKLKRYFEQAVEIEQFNIGTPIEILSLSSKAYFQLKRVNVDTVEQINDIGIDNIKSLTKITKNEILTKIKYFS